VDCNNFYASCERVFRPDLLEKPIVVLSNNDGCVIALSNEAKDLGYKRGDVFFKLKGQLKNDNVTVFSSNYALYGDLSARVMKVLEQFSPDIEVYSIDEAFLSFTGFFDLEVCAREIRDVVKRWSGIPVSVGIAPTKTLAKIANRVAKRWPGYGGAFVMEEGIREDILAKIEIGDVWGVGRQLKKHLNEMGVENALDFARLDPRLVRKKFSVVVERTLRELCGISCIPLEGVKPHPQNITVSRGFKGRIKKGRALAEAVSFYTSRAAEKAREKKVAARTISIFIRTNPFDNAIFYAKSAAYSFPTETNDTRKLVEAAIVLLKEIYIPGRSYQKAGVMLFGLKYNDEITPDFWSPFEDKKSTRLMGLLDEINQTHGHDTLRLATSGQNRTWFMAREHLSPRFTTKWDELRWV